MDLNEAVKNRHSVRAYQEKAIPDELISVLKAEIEELNRESGLHMQLFTAEPKAFSNLMAHYGKFRHADNYIAIVGEKSADLEEKAGYYGEKLVLQMQCLGLNSCWVVLTYAKGKVPLKMTEQEKLVCVIAFGYGADNGAAHKSKPLDKLYKAAGEVPSWFMHGLEMAVLAPTALNQQKFLFTLVGENEVKAEATGGFYAKIDLGIVKLHFEIGAGTDNFNWVK